MDTTRYWFSSGATAGADVIGDPIPETMMQTGSGYLERDYTTQASYPTSGTISLWFRNYVPGVNSNLFEGYINDSNRIGISWYRNEWTLLWSDLIGGTTLDTYLFTNKDNSSWYHLVVQLNNCTADSADLKVYLNGQVRYEDTITRAGSYPLNPGFWFGTPTQAAKCRIGKGAKNSNNAWKGGIANIVFTQNTIIPVSKFGKYNKDDVWIPREIELTPSEYGANGFFLQLASNIGDDPKVSFGLDSSGNGNNFTCVGDITITDDQTNNLYKVNVIDSPTRVYPYLDSRNTNNKVGISIPYIPLMNKNGNYNSVFGTMLLPNTGTYAWYQHQTDQDESSNQGTPYMAKVFRPGNWTNVWGQRYIGYTQVFFPDGTSSTSSKAGIGYNRSTQVPQIYNLDTGDSLMYTNFGGDFVNYLNLYKEANVGADTPEDRVGLGFIRGEMNQYVANGVYQWANRENVNWGQQVPYPSYTQGKFDENGMTRANDLCSVNLPEVPVTNGASGNRQLLGTGANILNIATGSTGGQSRLPFITSGFSGGLYFIKDNDTATAFQIVDSVRGTNVANLCPQTTGVAETAYVAPSSSNSCVAYCWRTPSNTGTNTNGTIQSQVAVNNKNGFSIVTYTGNDDVNATVGHGLDGMADCIIIMNRTTQADYPFYSKGIRDIYPDEVNNLFLNSTTSGRTAALMNNGGINYPSDNSTFGFVADGTDLLSVNKSGDQYVAYCWKTVEGYSSFSSYNGNASSQGPMFKTNFRPAMLMWKNVNNNSTDWGILNTAESTFNPCDKYQTLSTANPVIDSDVCDMLANSFIIFNNTSNEVNQNNVDFVFMAFAENPFAGMNVACANAR